MHIRIKPYNRAKGHVILDREIATAVWKKRFFAGKWYEVSDGVANLLRDQLQNPSKPHSPAAFDICTARQAANMVHTEQTEHLMQAERPTAKPMTPADIPPLEIQEDRVLNMPPAVHALQVQHPVAQPPVQQPTLDSELAGVAAGDAPMVLPDIADLAGAPEEKAAPKVKPLAERSVPALRDLAKANGIKSTGLRKDALVAALEAEGVS